MIRDALARIPLFKSAVVDGVLVERCSLLGFRVGIDADVLDAPAVVERIEASRWKDFGGPAQTLAGRGKTLGEGGASPLVTSADPSPPPGRDPAGGGAADGERSREELDPGDAAEARIAQLRQIHGRDAVRVTGRARAKRARWMPGVKVKLVVSYPKERSER